MTNLKISALIVAATTAFAAPAFASGLADSLGVEPGVYTQNQLIQLKSAIESDDVIRENFIRSQAGVVASAAERTAPGFLIEHAEQNGEYAKADFLKDWNAGDIDGPSASAKAEQNSFFATQAANEERRGS